jgi:RNA polymerase-binding transcription factor DksA
VSDTDTPLRLERINAKGWDVAQKLAEFLAGKEVDFTELDLFQLGAQKREKEERLRDFLAQINRARTRLMDDDYGLCLACGKAFDNAALNETPWLERCKECTRQRAEIL